MNFRQATDALLETVTLEDLAKAVGASVQAVRQARAAEGTIAFRSPPPGWERAVHDLAVRQARHYERLASKLKK
jgi:hypothetical protein